MTHEQIRKYRIFVMCIVHYYYNTFVSTYGLQYSCNLSITYDFPTKVENYFCKLFII